MASANATTDKDYKQIEDVIIRLVDSNGPMTPGQIKEITGIGISRIEVAECFVLVDCGGVFGGDGGKVCI